jgi:hypothetical protein
MAKAPDPGNAEQMAPVRDVSDMANKLGASQSQSQAPAKVDAIDACIQKWFVQNIYNSPASRDSEVFNYLQERLTLLRDALKELKL